jgi:hypothetical protein
VSAVRQDQINYLLKTPAAFSFHVSQQGKSLKQQESRKKVRENLLKTNFLVFSGKIRDFLQANQH